MGLLRRLKRLGRMGMISSLGETGQPVRWSRVCRFEQMEPRQLLSADVTPIHIGAVYYEDGGGEDQAADPVQITWTGGAAGTQLTELVINTDKQGDGLTNGDAFFDTAPGGLGDYTAIPLSIVSHTGFEVLSATVVDGGTTLVFHFAGFDPGEKLIFSVDMDEQGYPRSNAVVEGREYEGTLLTATFTADHFFDATGTDMFWDEYNGKLSGSGLDLPPDEYVPPGSVPREIYTAGAIFSVQQTPLPITLSGNVFEDLDVDNERDPGEQGLSGVQVSLYELVGTEYVATGDIRLTDGNGDYSFEGLLPGTYRVVETQPAGYLSVGARAGTVDDIPHGEVTSPDIISQVELVGGEDSIHNDFAEVQPVSLSGHVYHDANNDGHFAHTEETGIGNVTLTVERISSAVPGFASLVVTETDTSGFWFVENLLPGEYRVTESQPGGYLDGLDAAGTAGGTAHNPGDWIDGIHLIAGEQAEDYDFGEILPASISGRVHVDMNANGLYDSGEPLLEGVTIRLLDGSGGVIRTTLTNAAGEYRFDGLTPGVYGVEEIQPTGYYDSVDHVGSAGGTLLAPDSIVGVTLTSGTNGIRYDFCEVLPASLCGFVYVDKDNDGVREDGEQGIAGVTLTLLDSTGSPTVKTVVTDGDGHYCFSNLAPGTYGVTEAQPANYYDGLDTAGSAGGVAHNPGDSITGAVLGSGVHGEEYNFGELPPASIRGRVHAELNMDCIHQPEEPLLAGVTIYLLDASGARIASTHTDSLGEYVFSNLAPGTYGVEEIQPANYLQGRTHAGSEGGTVNGDFITEVVLGAGVDAVEYNFCELVPAKISGYVFQDGATIRYNFNESRPDQYIIRSGSFDPGDKPIAGVRLVLGDRHGEPILDDHGQPIVAVTNANGYYEFTMLRPGVYTILENQPAGYDDGNDTPGTKGGVAVNPNSTIDPMMLSELAVDPKNDAIIQIAISPGDNAKSYNFSEVRFESEPFGSPPSNPWQPWIEPDSPPVPYNPPPVVHYFSVPMPIEALPFYGGSGGPNGYTWHLSVINDGRPRRDLDYDNASFNPTNPYFDPTTWTGQPINQRHWVLGNESGTPTRRFDFGLPGATPVTGDWNGDGITEIGVFIDGYWFLDINGNGVWDQDDLWVQLGHQGDLPVTGDWDGDGKTDIGIFGPAWIGDLKAIQSEPGQPDVQNKPTGRYKNLPPDPQEATVGWRNMKRTAQGQFRADLIDHVFHFGTAGDRPVAGDWNGDGVTTIGIFRKGLWFLDVDGNGRWSEPDVYMEFGQDGDVPVVGDWNGDGITEIGVYRQGKWYLDTNGDHRLDAHDKVFELGGADDVPVVGDWNGDGVDDIGVYQDAGVKTQ